MAMALFVSVSPATDALLDSADVALVDLDLARQLPDVGTIARRSLCSHAQAVS
jgi:hypothetical protein